MTHITETIKEVINNIIANESATPIITVEAGSSVGDGFLGVTALVKVELNKEMSHYFIKMAATDPQLRKVTLQRDIFEKEIYFYSKLYPILNKLCLKYIKQTFDVVPKPSFTQLDDLKECIVMENLTTENYRVLKDKDTLNKEHLMMILKKYALLHACGFILKQEHGGIFNELLDSKNNLMGQLNTTLGFDTLLVNPSLDLLKKHCTLENDEEILSNIERIRDKSKNFVNVIENIDEYNTLLHIDCWRNNIMFKYMGNKLENIKIIDFQTWSINSPIFDISILIYTTSASQENLDNIDEYLNYYHICLNYYLSKMGGNVKELYPSHVLFEQWKKYAYYGLFYGIICLRGLFAGPDSTPNILQHIRDGKPLNQIFYFEIENEKEYCDRIKIMIKHFIKNKY
ncbi:uncharacterized protein [Onthophagus taurus]|uniref:uncharacterized protein n=1 Tax=Onthophagus taurus TaxID=166361 RepID=UPI0039BDCF1C